MTWRTRLVHDRPAAVVAGAPRHQATHRVPDQGDLIHGHRPRRDAASSRSSSSPPVLGDVAAGVVANVQRGVPELTRQAEAVGHMPVRPQRPGVLGPSEPVHEHHHPRARLRIRARQRLRRRLDLGAVQAERHRQRKPVPPLRNPSPKAPFRAPTTARPAEESSSDIAVADPGAAAAAVPPLLLHRAPAPGRAPRRRGRTFGRWCRAPAGRAAPPAPPPATPAARCRRAPPGPAVRPRVPRHPSPHRGPRSPQAASAGRRLAVRLRQTAHALIDLRRGDAASKPAAVTSRHRRARSPSP